MVTSSPAPQSPRHGSVALVTLGCVRNEVDSEELAGRLAAEGWQLVDDPADADVAVVNTCGFVEQAKKDSIDAVLEAADLKGGGRTRKVVAVGCLAERYGADLAAELPEADAVLGFDSYAQMSAHLRDVLAGEKPAAHVPHDRRTLLPLTPVERPAAAPDVAVPGLGGPVPRRRLDDRPWAPLKIASGCDRRCAFCAIPSFRGAFVSRPPEDVLAEARWLAEQGARELFLVSENSTSYGKDFGDLRALETMLPHLAHVPGVARVRVSYLQPAEIRPGLIDVIGDVKGIAPYFDLSFQHSSEQVLRRMRRFGSSEAFLGLIEEIREVSPEAGVRSNVIVGFPGETEEDVAELMGFLERARLDVCGVFAYSDEDGTAAAALPDKVDPDVIADRYERVSALVEELTAQRAEARIGERVQVLLEAEEDGTLIGRAAHQGPDVDGVCFVVDGPRGLAVGDLLLADVVGSDGVDLMVEAL